MTNGKRLVEPPSVEIETSVKPKQPLDLETVDAVLNSLLRADPPPNVMAASDQGLRVAMPPEVPVASDYVITDVKSALELCIPADLNEIVEAWRRARSLRSAHVTVHLRSDPDAPLVLYFIDARHRYGVFLVLFVGKNGAMDVAASGATLFRPRLCTVARNETSVIQEVDDAATKILGWSAAELIGLRTTELTHPDDREDAIATWMSMLGNPSVDHRGQMRYRRKDGTYVWLDITYHNRLGDPSCGLVVSQMVDVSDRMAAVEALRAHDQLLQRLTEALPLAIVQIDAARTIVYRNERANTIPGRAGCMTSDELFAGVIVADRSLLETALHAALSHGHPADIELTIEAGDARRRYSVGMRALCAEDGTVSGAIACISDISERVRLREELERRAKFDTLTHCHNRSSIIELLESAVRSRLPNHGLAVLFIDLDRFKPVNDRYGHAAGDELLRRTGQRLSLGVRGGDAVGRLGGDEFLIVCPSVATPGLALKIAQRLADDLVGPIEWAGTTLVPAASFGIAWTDGPTSADELVAIADAAMYESKRVHAPVLRNALT